MHRMKQLFPTAEPKNKIKKKKYKIYKLNVSKTAKATFILNKARPFSRGK